MTIPKVEVSIKLILIIALVKEVILSLSEYVDMEYKTDIDHSIGGDSGSIKVCMEVGMSIKLTLIIALDVALVLSEYRGVKIRLTLIKALEVITALS